MRLQGKVALISGAAHGMGEVEANMFATEGARVVIADILDHEAQQVVAAITRAGGEARFVHLDVTREEDWQEAVTTRKSYDRLISPRPNKEQGDKYMKQSNQQDS